MIIHIENELISKIEDMNKSEQNKFEEFIDYMYLAIKEGKHIISINKKDLLSLLKSNFLSTDSKKKLQFLNKIKIKYYQSIDNLIEKIDPSHIIYVTYNVLKKKQEKNIIKIYFPYSEFLNINFIQNFTLIVENIENDGLIYKNFFPMIYKKYKKIPFKYYLSLENGGGNTIHQVLEIKCKEENNNFNVFIVDGDRISHLKPGIGVTAKTIKSSYKKCKKKNYKNYLKFELYILKVRELENLIPLVFIKKFCEEFYEKYFQLIKVEAEITKYLDIKKGIICKDKNKKYQSVNECNIVECKKDDKIYCKLLKEVNLDFFVNNNGDKLLKEFYKEYNEKIEKLVTLVLDECQIENIKNDWIEIGRLIYSWGVGLEKQRIN
jgi:hypothetical protein